MPRPAPLAQHTAAGRLEPVRVALRWCDAAGGERVASAPFAAGSLGLGPCEVRVALDLEREAAGVDTMLRNPGAEPVSVTALVLGFRWRGPPGGGLRFLRHGWQSWSFCASRALDAAGEPPFPSGPWLRGMFHALGVPPADRAGWHESDLVTVVGPPEGGAACLAGVLEQGGVFGVVYLRPDDDGVAIEVELRVEAPLAPGAGRALERVRVALGPDAERLLAEFAEEHGRAAGARTRAPFQAGWCSWYHFFHDVTEADLLRNLDALVAARGEIPVRLVQLDDGYQRAVGDWLVTNEKFPRGLAPVARAIRDAGFEAGLWTAPFCVAPDSALYTSVRHWCLREGDAPFLGLLHPMWTPSARIHVLDASREEVRAHLTSLFRELTAMGFRYQKLDFLYAEAMQAEAFDPAMTRAERLRRGLEAIRAGCGDDVFVLGCGCPLGPAVGLVDGMRIGPDVAPHWEVQDDPPIAGIEVTRPSTRNALRSILSRAFLHRRLWLNDPDCLMSRTDETALSPVEARALAAAVAATGGMVLFSDDVPKLAPDSRALVAETIRLAREVDDAGPVGVARVPRLLAREFPPEVVAEVPGGILLALVNAGEAPELRSADEPALRTREQTAAAGRPGGGGGTAARDAWRPEGLLGRDVALEDAAALRVAPHAVALLRQRTGPPLTVFCDFDGTFIVQDVGSTLAQRHAGPRRPQEWARFERGEITAWGYNLEILDGLAVSEPMREAFLRDEIALDPGARALLAFCARHDVPFRILSDGFEPNIARLQELHDLHFPYEANRLRVEDGRWRIAAALPGLDCGCGTGNCKRMRIEAWRRHHPGTLVVHVGNGRVSDLCGARAADVAFAKGSLAKVMAEAGEPFEPFETLYDVVAWLARHLGVPAPEAGRDD